MQYMETAQYYTLQYPGQSPVPSPTLHYSSAEQASARLLVPGY